MFRQPKASGSSGSPKRTSTASVQDGSVVFLTKDHVLTYPGKGRILFVIGDKAIDLGLGEITKIEEENDIRTREVVRALTFITRHPGLLNRLHEDGALYPMFRIEEEVQSTAKEGCKVESLRKIRFHSDEP